MKSFPRELQWAGCLMVEGLDRHSKCSCSTCSIGLDTEIQCMVLVCFRRGHARACHCRHMHAVRTKAAQGESIGAFGQHRRDNIRRHRSHLHKCIEFLACGGIESRHAWLSCMGAGNRASAKCSVGMQNMCIKWRFSPNFGGKRPQNVGYIYDGEMKLGTLLE